MDSQEDDTGVVHRIYNRLLRSYLPYRISVHNGIPTKRHARLLDFTDKFPEYEGALISAIRNQIQERDKVVVVGGGLGVSTVAAVNATGRRGSVVTYEGSKRQYNTVKETVQLNLVSDCVELNHAVVGSFSEHSSDTYGEEKDGGEVAPSMLPECDVLVLDCEGAEIEILYNMEQLPRVIIVETHAFLDSPEEQVREILSDKEYSVINRGVEWESKGVTVLTASR